MVLHGGAAGPNGGIGFGGNGQTNLGFGGGVLGFGGGQQGQFGNLGGQFGLQGGDTSAILIELIEYVIAPKEWQLRAARYLFNNTNTTTDDRAAIAPTGPTQFARLLPAGPGPGCPCSFRIQTRVAAGDFAPARWHGRPIDPAPRPVIRPGDRARDPGRIAVAAVPTRGAGIRTSWRKHRGIRRKFGMMRSKSEAPISPRHVIAVSDALAIGDKFDEIVALLKADLRHGVLAEPCVFDALAIALKASGGTPEERENVMLSA